MKLFYKPGACSLASHITLRESGKDFTLDGVDLAKKRLENGDDYFAVNPKGQVPALLLDDGTLLTEGVAIMQYLADSVPDRQLLAPTGTISRYKTLEWLNYIATELHKGFTPLFRPDTPEEYTFKYTYNIDLNTGESIRLKDHVDVEKLAENMFAGTGYYVKEDLADYFRERLEAIYDSPDALAQSLAGYDYSEDGTAPYGYSYLADGKVWICMEVPHALGDYIEIELDTQ